MLYFILRPIVKLLFKAYFRKIYVNGVENLPKDGPLIVCTNHPTGFIEPCLFACYLPRVFYFLVRGDLFRKPLLRQILIGTNQLPIYRMRDGFKEIRNNPKIMKSTYQSVAEGKAIMIFAEGSTADVRYLRPLQRGAARLAVGTMDNYPEKEVKIIPIGVDFSSPNRFRSIATINIGEAFSPKLPDTEKEYPRYVRNLTQEIFDKLSKLLLAIKDEKDNDTLNEALEIHDWTYEHKSFPICEHKNNTYYRRRRALSEGICHSDLKTIEDQIDEIEAKIEPLDSKNIVPGKNSWQSFFLSAIIFIPVSIGILLNILPAIIGRRIAIKFVKKKEFFGAITIAGGLSAYILLYLLAFVLILIFNPIWLILLILTPYIGVYVLPGYDFIREQIIRKRNKNALGKGKLNQMLLEGHAFVNNLIKENV